MDLKAPITVGVATASHYLYVEAVDSAFERALDAGAMPLRSPRNEYWGDRTCMVRDPDGHLWMLSTNVPSHDAWKEARERIEAAIKDPND